ncbi:MAG: NAD(P)/FAD-dependent oxidoreductase, partial [Candidatus Heimdallarchaeota archaeon]
IDRGSNSMVVIDRIALDNYFAERATKIGCKFFLGHRVRQVKNNGNYWSLYIKHNNKLKVWKSKLLISAEGVHARLAASLGLPFPDKNWLFPAIQMTFEGVTDFDKDCVELFFGRNYAPGFFGWLIPVNEELVRAGVAIGRVFNGKTRLFMKRFLKKHPHLRQRFKKAKIRETYGGLVPGTGPIKKTYLDRFMVIGDAAGQSKATTGGGVNIGGYCGRLAGIMAGKIISEKLSTYRGCLDYQRKWQAQFEPDLSIMKLFRRMLTPLPDKTWDKIIQIAKETDLQGYLKNSDIDLHGTSLLQYSLAPRILMKSTHLLPQVAVSLLHGLSI